MNTDTLAPPVVAPLDWQPIATAPRNGTLIRVRHPEHGAHLVQWDRRRKVWKGTDFGIMGPIRWHWTKTAEQPTEWAAVE